MDKIKEVSVCLPSLFWWGSFGKLSLLPFWPAPRRAYHAYAYHPTSIHPSDRGIMLTMFFASV
jgi:hypothetical protein